MEARSRETKYLLKEKGEKSRVPALLCVKSLIPAVDVCGCVIYFFSFSVLFWANIPKYVLF